MFDKIKASAEAAIHTGKIFWTKNSPTILFVSGIVAVIGGTVLACNATLKVPEIIEDRDETLNEIKRVEAENNVIDIPDEDVEIITPDTKKEIVSTHAKTILKIAKEYAPAVIVEVIGIALLTKSQKMLVKRYLAMASAYTALQTEFTLYRNAVKEKYGEEADRELLFGIHNQTIKRINEDGTETEEEVKVFDVSKYGQNSAEAIIIFDENSSQWDNKSMSFNRRYVDMCIYNANEMLNERGRNAESKKSKNGVIDDCLVINEIADMLDCRRTVAGAFLGFKYDRNNPCKITYDIVPAGITLSDGNALYDDRNTKALIIRLNVDGNVIEMANNKE